MGNPFDRVWPPTTSGYLQPIFSCVDSRGTHPLCVYVREYGMWYVRGYVLGVEGVSRVETICFDVGLAVLCIQYVFSIQ